MYFLIIEKYCTYFATIIILFIKVHIDRYIQFWESWDYISYLDYNTNTYITLNVTWHILLEKWSPQYYWEINILYQIFNQNKITLDSNSITQRYNVSIVNKKSDSGVSLFDPPLMAWHKRTQVECVLLPHSYSLSIRNLLWGLTLWPPLWFLMKNNTFVDNNSALVSKTELFLSLPYFLAGARTLTL